MVCDMYLCLRIGVFSRSEVRVQKFRFKFRFGVQSSRLKSGSGWFQVSGFKFRVRDLGLSFGVRGSGFGFVARQRHRSRSAT